MSELNLFLQLAGSSSSRPGPSHGLGPPQNLFSNPASPYSHPAASMYSHPMASLYPPHPAMYPYPASMSLQYPANVYPQHYRPPY